MLGSARKSPAQLQALEAVRQWTSQRFSLLPDETVMVTEMACSLPGCPPLETVIAFWTADGKRHHYKIFKPALEVVEDDLPPYWMKDALVVPEGMSCDCC
ncbi:hypothetical protein SAMN06265795_11034 [Noviherbaspirillum humi]|uniref:Uncharacterized protein n=1 Tax=Noviherbaspirillum humi TaxID=1688639 RepID=A0A239IMJ7_9BURK|nr:hypothetical protein [Noviherbaspirillum humi]SNS94900.1 hypothetical protein SAMN06265795_11034 [Noviherbaspirillum humi]